MTVRSLFGLALLNVFALGVGMGVLWGLRGWRSWWELARLAGFAYMLGVAALGVALALGLVVGIPFSLPTILLTGLLLASAGLGAGVLLGRPRPVLGPAPHRVGLAGAAMAALVIVYLEALFRAARLSGLYAFDAWSFWVPKAKAIYFFDGLDEQFFSELPNATYPPFVPTLEATAFHFMGSADVVTLHVQFWFLLAGFVAAVAGLLATRVPPVLLWSFALLAIVSPRAIGRTLEPQADFTLDYVVRARRAARRPLADRAPSVAAGVRDALSRSDHADEARGTAAGRLRGRSRARRLLARVAERLAASGPGVGLRVRHGPALAALVRVARPHG